MILPQDYNELTNFRQLVNWIFFLIVNEMDMNYIANCYDVDIFITCEAISLLNFCKFIALIYGYPCIICPIICHTVLWWLEKNLRVVFFHHV